MIREILMPCIVKSKSLGIRYIRCLLHTLSRFIRQHLYSISSIILITTYFGLKSLYVANLAGIVMAAVAALPGFIDWLGIPANIRAKKTGLFHMLCNVIALVLFAACFFLQKDKWNDANPDIGSAIPLTASGFLITLIAGFLGFALIQKHHVGVDPFTNEETRVAASKKENL